MTVEDRLRRAIEERTSSVEVDDQAGLEAITARLAAAEDPPILSTPGIRRVLAAAAAGLVIAATGALLVANRGGSGTDVDISDRPGPRPPDAEPVPSPATTEPGEPPPAADEPAEIVDPPDTTTAPSTTTTVEPDEPEPAAAPPVPGALWPRPSSDVRFDDPRAAARSFALYYARFDDPEVGTFQAADSHSGEVPVRPFPDGPVSLVRVAASPEGQWFVTGSWNDDIVVDRPRPGATLGCPMVTDGVAFAFEGTVQVRIDAYRSDGNRVEMGRGFVTGSGAHPPGPFSGEIACTTSSGVEEFGVVTFWTDDASGRLDGPLQLVAVPVRLP